MKKVSVIIPVYNLEKYLQECLNSVVNQSYTELQIVLVNDGSTDKSLEICRKYEKKDSRVKVLNQKNRGVSSARNAGIKTAVGDYLMFVDGDDYIDAYWIENYLKVAQENNADVVIGGMTFLLQNGDRIEKKPFLTGNLKKEIWNLICADETGIFGYTPNKLYRTEVLKRNGILFNENMHAQEDLDFALSVYGISRQFSLIEEVGYTYRYVSEKRNNHPLLHYIDNQLKMLKLANEQTVLNACAEDTVIERVLELLYKYIYYLPINKSFIEECKKIEIELEMQKYICRYQKKSESWLITQLLLHRQYHVIKFYFSIRHLLRQILRRE